MIFDTLYESAQRGELLLISGGFCHWHLCTRGGKRGQVTIREVISTRPGAGAEMLEILKRVNGAMSIFAKCPEWLEANNWYAKKGFVLEGQETTKTGRKLNLWRLQLTNPNISENPTPAQLTIWTLLPHQPELLES